jgi:HSP20 family molecular chaperone IbpA
MTLRVMFLVNSLCVGGAEKHVVSLVNGLDVRRHRLALTALKREEGLLPQIDQDQLADGLACLEVDHGVRWQAVRRLARQLESAARTSQENGWPPYNIETTGENEYRIEIAVAGFKPDELTIEAKENQLTVTGRKTANDDAAAQKTYLHRGSEVVEYESVPGNYVGFYLQVKDAIAGKGQMPVSHEDILMIAKIIDDAFEKSIHKK